MVVNTAYVSEDQHSNAAHCTVERLDVCTPSPGALAKSRAALFGNHCRILRDFANGYSRTLRNRIVTAFRNCRRSRNERGGGKEDRSGAGECEHG